MRPLPLADSVRLPVEQALQRHFDDHNWHVLRWLLAGFLPGALVGALVSFEEGQRAVAIAWGVGWLAVVGLVLTRRTRFFERHFRQLLLAYLVLQLAVLVTVSSEPGFGYALGGFLFPGLVVLLRLRRGETAGLLALSLGIAVWRAMSLGESEPAWGAWLGTSLGALIGCLVALFTSLRLASRRGRAFLSVWHAEHERTEEQMRMREELDDARQIQLSMLPRSAPSLPWLDLASASLPATEVGGDYFDYVPLDGDRLAIVVGDVAGHGMSSGLVLAAIRGGLHLLRAELANPQTALERLDRMVQEIAPGRMYVTLQIAILDHRERRLVVVSAGHPPVLHCRAARGGAVAEVGRPAIPLGTRLTSRLSEDVSALEPGDVLLFYSDGVVEAADVRGEPFGDRRLAEALSRSATGHSASEVRSSILDSLNRFKGDVELADDLTVVVASISG
jgi:serine phosphatase RsbU (regulator of sigma subunit)